MIDQGLVVAGHQPNFFPWFGYFEKMLKCDLFVFSDDVQYPKQSWVNRVRIPVNGVATWFSLPVVRGDDARIADKRFAKDEAVLDRLLKTVRINLGGLPYGRELDPLLEEFTAAFRRFDTVADLNIHMVLTIANLIGINTPTRRGTELGLERYHRNERLIRRCELLGSKTYLCGQGADGYQDEALLRSAGIALRHIDYALGRKLLGDEMTFSILHSIASKGVAGLKQDVFSRGAG